MWLVGTSEVRGNLPFRLLPGSYVVGRSKRMEICIADATVSRRHARMEISKGRLSVEDLGSANGTRVNDCPVSHSELQAGDLVQFGSVACVVTASPLAVPTTTPEEPTHLVQRHVRPTTSVDGLTDAQQSVVNLVVAGRTEDEIATILDRSPHTIHTHLKAIFRRLGVHSRAELIVRILHQD